MVYPEVCCVRLKFGFVSPPLIGTGGGLVCESIWNGVMLLAHFDGKQSRDPVDRSVIHLPSVPQSHYLCHQVTGGEAAYAGSWLLWWHWSIGYVSSCFEEDSWGSGQSSCCGISAAPSFGYLSYLLESGKYVTPTPKGTPSPSVSNYRPIYLTAILSKVFERLVSVCFGRVIECRGVLPTTQFAYKRGLGNYDALLCVAHTLQSALEMGQEVRIVQIDFSAAFDMVKH